MHGAWRFIHNRRTYLSLARILPDFSRRRFNRAMKTLHFDSNVAVLFKMTTRINVRLPYLLNIDLESWSNYVMVFKAFHHFEHHV